MTALLAPGWTGPLPLHTASIKPSPCSASIPNTKGNVYKDAVELSSALSLVVIEIIHAWDFTCRLRIMSSCEADQHASQAQATRFGSSIASHLLLLCCSQLIRFSLLLRVQEAQKLLLTRTVQPCRRVLLHCITAYLDLHSASDGASCGNTMLCCECSHGAKMQAERPPPFFQQFLSFLTSALPQADGCPTICVCITATDTKAKDTRA